MPLKPGSSKEAFSHNVRKEMDSGKPQKQALAIAYAVKRRAKMAKGGVMFTCPNCLAQGQQCEIHQGDDNYAHGGTVESREPNSASGPVESHLDNEARAYGQKYPPESKKKDMFASYRQQEPSDPYQESQSPTMDRSVRGMPDSYELAASDSIMRKRKDRGSNVGRYAMGGQILRPQDPELASRSLSNNEDRPTASEDSQDPRNPYSPQGRRNPESHGSEGDTLDPNGPQEIESQKPKRYTEDGKRMLASGGYLDPNKPQSIENQIPPYEPEGEDRSEELDKVHPNDSSKQHYGDLSEDGIQSMHDYSLLPESSIPEVLDPEHDSDMPDIAQQNSLIGQIMKKRRQLKRP